MAKSFRDLRARMSPEAQETAAKKARAMLAEMPTYFIIAEQTGYQSVPSVLSESVHVRRIVSASIDIHKRGIQGQLRLYTHAGASGAAAGALTQMSGAHVSSIFHEIGDKRYSLPNAKGITDYGTLERH
jgi:hypothetical protein